MAKFALLIGVSEYESGLNQLPATIKDVDALQRVLQDSEIGEFETQNITVLKNPQRQAMEEAIAALFFNRHKDDLLLLYFSGHGITDDSGRLYITTSQTRKNDRGELITTSSVAASFIHRMMEDSTSRRQVIILDCCFSGAFAEGMKAKDGGNLDILKQLADTTKENVEGRAVLTSSTASQRSFEQQGFDLSIYTHYLVQGIAKGVADTNGDGVISVGELHEYARKKVHEVAPAMKPGIFIVKEGYKIGLAKALSISPENHTPTPQKNKIELGELKLGSIPQTENINDLQQSASYLPNFLEPYDSFITELIARVKDDSLIADPSCNSLVDNEIENRILEIIRVTSQADFVFVISNNKHKNCFVEFQSNLAENIKYEVYKNTLNTIVFPIIIQDLVFNPAYHGIYKIHECHNDDSKAFVMIPLKSSPEAQIMVVCGLPKDSYLLGDAYGRILTTFYHATQRVLQPELIEATIIDDLKRDFGFICASLYKRRFNLFRERLKGMVVYFEPILRLNPRRLSISGWEALARNPDNWKVPSDLFEAAELWGPRFTIELDQHFLTVAIQSYRQARIKAKQNRVDEIKPLSVNVYPESLMRKAYYETVRYVLKEVDPLIEEKLILEISEKTNLPTFNNGVHLEEPLKAFKQRLMQYTQEFDIKFGIDDFGVGYASVSRLAGLNPPYVKIDREILYHQPTEIIIKFVHELMKADSLRSKTDVIVEGIDEDSPISLRQLREIGVSYIQGYIVGKASTEIYRLSREKYYELKRRILGETI